MDQRSAPDYLGFHSCNLGAHLARGSRSVDRPFYQDARQCSLPWLSSHATQFCAGRNFSKGWNRISRRRGRSESAKCAKCNFGSSQFNSSANQCIGAYAWIPSIGYDNDECFLDVYGQAEFGRFDGNGGRPDSCAVASSDSTSSQCLDLGRHE